MDQIKEVEIVFENSESIVIPKEKFKKLEFGEIKSLIFPGMVYEGNKCFTDTVIMEINYQDESELEYDLGNEGLLGGYVDNPLSNKVEDRPNILGRILNLNDITWIDLINQNGEVEKTICVPWDKSDDFRNNYMSVEKKNETIQITIKNR